jgi:hypothetical protein
MKPSNFEGILNAMFESLNLAQRTQAVGGAITHIPTHTTTLTSAGQTDIKIDIDGDLPTN